MTSLHLVHGQNMPKKGKQEKIFFCTFNKGQLHILKNEKNDAYTF